MRGIGREWEAAALSSSPSGPLDRGSLIFGFQLPAPTVVAASSVSTGIGLGCGSEISPWICSGPAWIRSGCLNLEGPSTLGCCRVLQRPAERTGFGSPIPSLVVVATAPRGVQPGSLARVEAVKPRAGAVDFPADGGHVVVAAGTSERVTCCTELAALRGIEGP